MEGGGVGGVCDWGGVCEDEVMGWVGGWWTWRFCWCFGGFDGVVAFSYACKDGSDVSQSVLFASDMREGNCYQWNDFI